jgi:hypothetical protein
MEIGNSRGLRYANNSSIHSLFGFSERDIQLKKDYVPGYGDTIDLVVIAAAWEKDRARELRGVFYLRDFKAMMMNQGCLVSTSTLTTFYIAVLSNSSQMNIDVSAKIIIVMRFNMPLLAWLQTSLCCILHCLIWFIPRTA